MNDYSNLRDTLYCGGRYDPIARFAKWETHQYIILTQESLRSWEALEEGDQFYDLKDRAIAVLNDDLGWCYKHIENLEREEEWKVKASQKSGFVAKLTSWLRKK